LCESRCNFFRFGQEIVLRYRTLLFRAIILWLLGKVDRAVWKTNRIQRLPLLKIAALSQLPQKFSIVSKVLA
jgi:hypothetical protein